MRVQGGLNKSELLGEGLLQLRHVLRQLLPVGARRLADGVAQFTLQALKLVVKFKQRIFLGRGFACIAPEDRHDQQSAHDDSRDHPVVGTHAIAPLKNAISF